MIDEVVFLRHGRTSFNLERRLQGQIDVPLDIVGQWQADQTALELAKRFYWAKVSFVARNPSALAHPGANAVRDSSIDEYRQAPASHRVMRVVSSDLFRAQQTAHAFADILGLPVALDPRLRERSFGRWEGLSRREIHDMDADAYESWKTTMGGEKRYGVESREEVGVRGAKAVEDLVASSQQSDRSQTLVIVGHGSWIVAAIGVLLGIEPDGGNNLSAMRNAFWSTMSVVHRSDGGVNWHLDEFDQGPQIARFVDWENGPADLRNPGMPMWRQIP
ncbi:MAG: histidine phosphatase family protein [Bifidobacterium sp.]|jgi:2,3-bisphosphoglycerate-dependent phosphoglycerate mutase